MTALQKYLTSILILPLTVLIVSCRTNNQSSETKYNGTVADTIIVPEFQSLPEDKFYTGPFDIACYFGFQPESVYKEEIRRIPKIPGMVWMTDNRTHFGLRCPQNKALLKFASSRAKRFADWEDTFVIDSVTTSLPLYENPRSAKDICDHYIAPRLTLPTFPLNEDSVVEQFATVIADSWSNQDFTTFQEVCWYDCMSCGDNTERSWFTVDNHTGALLSMWDIIDESRKEDFAKLTLRHLVNASGHWLTDKLDVLKGDYSEYLSEASGCAIIKEGVIVYYHPYVMGCGADGQYNSVIPFNELDGIILKTVR